MTITKPFTFAAGTKARANEVNTNFDVLYAQVNTNISDIASLSNEISGFDLTKADVNGSALNTFAVKDPVNSSDAVNKGYVLDLLKSIYPVGSIYIGTTSTCPMSSLFGTWSLVSSGKALWTGNGSNANTTIAAGLPNITGHTRNGSPDDGIISWYFTNGVFYTKPSSAPAPNVENTGGSSTENKNLWFDASRSNSVYGNSSTVQPPAYVVNVWRRTA